MASIELRASKVFGDFYHLYIVYTKDNGEQWVLRGGPSGSGPAGSPIDDVASQLVGGSIPEYGNVLFQYEKYTNSDGTPVVYYNHDGSLRQFGKYQDGLPIDYPRDGETHYISDTKLGGSEASIATAINVMLQKGAWINNEGFEYAPNHQNSNTVATTLMDSVAKPLGLEYNLPKIDGDEVYAPAAFGDFDHNFGPATILGDRLEDTVNYLEENIGKPFLDILRDAGKTAGEWIDSIGDKLDGVSLSDLLNNAKDVFAEVLGIPSTYAATEAPNGNVILQGSNGQDTVINPDGTVHTGIPHNIAVGNIPAPTNSLPIDLASHSPFIDGLFGGIPSSGNLPSGGGAITTPSSVLGQTNVNNAIKDFGGECGLWLSVESILRMY